MRDWTTEAFGSIAELIHAHAAEAPARRALIDGERTIDWRTLDTLIDRVAAALQAGGCARGDCIAICAASSIEYVATFLGALRAGVAVAPLAPSSTSASLARMQQDADAKLLFLDASTEQAFGALIPGAAIARIALDGSAAGRVWDDWLTPIGTRPAAVEITPKLAFNIIYSSGTTGEPKGIVQSHAMRWAHVVRGASYDYGPDSVTLLSTPLYSNTTLVTFFPTLAFGGCIVLMNKFDAGRYLELAQRWRATHTMLVPVQYQRIMAQPDFDSFDLSSFKYKFSTSAPFSAAVKADVLKRWPGGLIEFYGMTEGGGTCILEVHLHPSKLHTVGPPAATSDIRLIDDAGGEVAPGEAGEVVGHSPGMMTGYHRQPDKTREAEWFSPEGKRFIRTGDIGRFDEDGFLILFDRKKDMIISGGFNIYPSDLEAVLREHPRVADCSVIGVPSDAWGETPVAWVVPRDGRAGDDSVDEAGLRDWANQRLGKTQRIAALHLTPELPRSAIGKVLKRELRDRHAAQTMEPSRGKAP